MNNPLTETTNMSFWQKEGCEIVPFHIPSCAGLSPSMLTHIILSDFEEERRSMEELQAWDILSDAALMNFELGLP